jgi:hypothetical protein
MAYVPVVISDPLLVPVSPTPVIISGLSQYPPVLAAAPAPVLGAAPAPVTGSATSTKIGRTVLTGLVVGQDSSSIPRRKGFSYDFFYAGEPVSITRTDGRKNIAEVLSASESGLVVSVGGGVQKNYPPTAIPDQVSKLLGAYYFRE